MTVPSACLNCAAPLGGEFCGACGQRAVDLAAPTWAVVRDAVSDAADLDGRVVRTLRAMLAPGCLTEEFLRGRRTPYVGPLKLLLFAGALLSTTWVMTRGIDSHFYGFESGQSAADYIARVVRGSLAACVIIALSNWVISRARRRLLDETVFAVHVVAALSLFTALVIWVGTAFKLVFGTVAAVPRWMPALPFLLFIPAAVLGLAYVAAALRRVHGDPWWLIALRAVVITTLGLGAVTAVVLVWQSK